MTILPSLSWLRQDRPIENLVKDKLPQDRPNTAKRTASPQGKHRADTSSSTRRGQAIPQFLILCQLFFRDFSVAAFLSTTFCSIHEAYRASFFALCVGASFAPSRGTHFAGLFSTTSIPDAAGGHSRAALSTSLTGRGGDTRTSRGGSRRGALERGTRRG